MSVWDLLDHIYTNIPTSGHDSRCIWELLQWPQASVVFCAESSQLKTSAPKGNCILFYIDFMIIALWPPHPTIHAPALQHLLCSWLHPVPARNQACGPGTTCQSSGWRIHLFLHDRWLPDDCRLVSGLVQLGPKISFCGYGRFWHESML